MEGILARLSRRMRPSVVMRHEDRELTDSTPLLTLTFGDWYCFTCVLGLHCVASPQLDNLIPGSRLLLCLMGTLASTYSCTWYSLSDRLC